MRLTHFPALALLLIFCPAGRGDDPGHDDLLKEVLKVAKSEKTLLIRTSAIDTLGALGPKAGLKVVEEFTAMLADPPKVAVEEQTFFKWHLVRALGKIGPDAIKSVPFLLKEKGNDTTLNKAIDEAIQSILKAPPTPTTPPAKPPAAAPKKPVSAAKSILDLQADLKNADENVRLVAARELGKRGAEAQASLKDLIDAMQNDPDPDIRLLAVESASEVTGKGKVAPEYLAGLTQMLEDPNPRVRLAAARHLGGAGTAAASAKDRLTRLGSEDTDEDVKCVAKKIGEAKKSKD